MTAPIALLTDREKRTLRLLLDGHDAKSAARHLDLSVHTVNERLREARRKLSVSSSREAARLLRLHEATAHECFGNSSLGDAPFGGELNYSSRPSAVGPAIRGFGGVFMIILAALLTLSMPSSSPQALPPAVADADQRTDATDAALRFLGLIDAERWEESRAVTGRSFRAVNTLSAWRAASLKVRDPLGKVQSRQWLSEVDTPSPPDGITVVRFRTDFARGAGVTETLSLHREDGTWKVVGIYLQ